MKKNFLETITFFIHDVLNKKKTKATVYVVAVLWLAVLTQVFVNYTFYKEAEITDAFKNSDAKERTSSIEVVGEYHSGPLSEEDKKSFIYSLADSIDLVVDKDIVIIREDNRSEFAFEKQAEKANTTIKLISLEEHDEDGIVSMSHYLFVRIKVNDSIESINPLKERLTNCFDKLKFKDVQTTLVCTGSYDGELSLEEKDAIVTIMIDELQGSVALKNIDQNIFTVYAYTGMVKEYIKSSGSKINVQIAITYDEESDKSYVYLATPLLADEW